MVTMYVIKLGRYKVILGTLWMKEYAVFPNIIDSSIMFLLNYYDYWGADYTNTLPITELINRSLPKYK